MTQVFFFLFVGQLSKWVISSLVTITNTVSLQFTQIKTETLEVDFVSNQTSQAMTLKVNADLITISFLTFEVN